MENIQIKGVFAVVGILLIIFLGVKSWESWQDMRLPRFDRPTITVTGEGKVFAKPDIGEISLAVNSEARTVEEAQRDATAVANRIVAVLKEKGVEEKDIQTTNYSIGPIYDYPDGTRRLRSYQVNQNLKVKIRELAKTGEILAAASQAGANQVGGLSFTTDDPTAIQTEAREKAIEDAKAKAQELAAKLGIKLGKIIGFNEFGGVPPMPFFGAVAEKGMGRDFPAPQIPVGENEIRVNVNVTYQIK